MEKYNPQLIPKLRQLINDGEFSYNPMYANLHTMMLGHETLMRTMSYGRLLEGKGFRRSYMANASDAFSVGWDMRPCWPREESNTSSRAHGIRVRR